MNKVEWIAEKLLIAILGIYLIALLILVFAFGLAATILFTVLYVLWDIAHLPKRTCQAALRFLFEPIWP